MAGHQGMPHGMPMSHANQIPSSAATGMSQIPGPQMSQPQVDLYLLIDRDRPARVALFLWVILKFHFLQKMIPSPQVQQQMQQQQQQQSQQQQSHIPDNSSIEKMKALVPHLKKSLANLMRWVYFLLCYRLVFSVDNKSFTYRQLVQYCNPGSDHIIKESVWQE